MSDDKNLLRTRFEQRVRPYMDAQRSLTTEGQNWPPVLVYTGGQPGAGKSRANERVAQQRPTLVPVIGDDLRQFHPDYARLMREDPLSMPQATAQASGAWIAMSADYLRKQRADVLIETTLRSPDAMSSTIAEFREAGYVVELRVVAVPHEVSRLSTVERYVGQVMSTGAGRWTPTTLHDQAFEKATETTRILIATGLVDRFVIENRVGTVLLDRSYFGLRDAALRHAGNEAAEALDNARNISHMTAEDGRRWLILATEQIRLIAGLEQTVPDFMETITKISHIDALAIAEHTYSENPEQAHEAAQNVRMSVDRDGL